MESLGKLIGVGILLLVSFWIFKDAKSRGMNATGWAVFVFLLLIIGLPAYFILRKPKMMDSDNIKNTDAENQTE